MGSGLVWRSKLASSLLSFDCFAGAAFLSPDLEVLLPLLLVSERSLERLERLEWLECWDAVSELVASEALEEPLAALFWPTRDFKAPFEAG